MENNKNLLEQEEKGFVLWVYQIKGGYSAVISNKAHTLWRKDFNCAEKVQEAGLFMLKSLCLTDEYLYLSEKYYADSQYFNSVGDEQEAKASLKKAFLYKDKYHASKGLELLS